MSPTGRDSYPIMKGPGAGGSGEGLRHFHKRLGLHTYGGHKGRGQGRGYTLSIQRPGPATGHFHFPSVMMEQHIWTRIQED